ncbi:hypothetical protein WA158_002312 [Blastocystis sp. Blastoise]
MSEPQQENLSQIIREHSVPEVRLKKRRRFDIEHARKIAENIKNKKRINKKTRAENRFITPEKVVNESINRDNDRRRRNRQEKRMKYNQINVSCKEEVVIVVKTRSTSDASKNTRLVLKDLKLKENYTARFYRMTEDLKRKLILAQPFLAWGKPNNATIQMLLNKRAYTIVDDNKVPISDNIMVEKALGDKNIICIADLIYEIQTLGPNFDAVLDYLAPFPLSNPSSGVETKLLHQNIIQSGDLGDNINKLISKML